MRIDNTLFKTFVSTWFRYDKDGRETAKTLLTSDRGYALTQMTEFDESDYLEKNMRDSVQKIPRGKDSAVRVYQRFVQFLQQKGVEASVVFPPIPIDSSFERQMFIAKYLQAPDARIQDLSDILWVSERTIETDLERLYRDSDDPIQICGRRFSIPEATRSKGQIHHASTVHPLFLTENLTQVIIMLKGLRAMAQDPKYAPYAEATGADIWEQLSDYAKKRIRFVLGELMPEDLSWYQGLERKVEDSFYTEYRCSVHKDVLMDCFKNDKPFQVEYQEDDGTVIYKDCRIIHGTFDSGSIEVECAQGRKKLYESRILRSCYTAEEMLAD